jgi:DnaJ-class molecular chaperone
MRVEDLLATMCSGADPATLLDALTKQMLESYHQELHRLLGSAPEDLRGSPYQVLGLAPSAADEVVKYAYKHLAKKAHPDAGGSAEAMARLNKAYEEIARERGWK